MISRRLRVALALLLAPPLLVVALAASRATLRSPPPTLLLRDRHGRFVGEVGSPDGEGFGYWSAELPTAEADPRQSPDVTASPDPSASSDLAASPDRAGSPDPSASPASADLAASSAPSAARLPWRVVAATLALEDRRFWDHPGVDPRAVARALRDNRAAGHVVSGASTLAMQVARMQDPGPRTLPRKAVEATTALLLTARYGREAILAQYLRLAPYGNGIHGITYAARRYFDKPVEDLSWAETAFLSALPQAPSLTNPFRPEGRARAVARARRILAELYGQGLLTTPERDAALDELGRLRIPDRGTRPVAALHAVLRLEDQLGTPEARARLGGRPLVTTTLDLDLQASVLDDVRSAVEEWKDRGAGNAAVLVLDRATGEVLADVGSTAYFDGTHAGSIDYTRVPRNPGSTLKPFFYARALDARRITPTTILDDLARGPDGIEDADGTFLGPLLPRRALANSRNVPAVEVLQRIGLDEGYGLLRDLGLHHDEFPARHYGWGLAVGGLPVTLEALVGAYGTLAGDGRMRDPVWIADTPAEPGRRVFSEEAARTVSRWLSDPMARLPTFPRMGATEYPFPVAVKTGTSSDYRDAWTVAWSSRYLVGVWVGDPDWQPMARLSGFTAAAEIVHRVLTHLHSDEADGLSDVSFPPPTGLEPARVCALTGHLAGDNCPSVVTEYLRHDDVPTEPCTAHVRRTVDVRDGLLATARTPARFTREETFVDLPARYAVWQVSAGLSRPPTTPSPLGAHDGAPISAPPAFAVADAPSVRITSPADGTHVIRDVDVPTSAATLALEATVDPPVPQVVWYVDGHPWRTVDWPYATRWPLAAGKHVFEARVPFRDVASPRVTITGQ